VGRRAEQVHACTPGTQEGCAGRSPVQGQLPIHRDTLPQKKKGIRDKNRKRDEKEYLEAERNTDEKTGCRGVAQGIEHLLCKHKAPNSKPQSHQKNLIIIRLARCQWPTPVILATQEAEIRRTEVRRQPGQIVRKTLSQKTLHLKGLVEWLKVKALSSNSSSGGRGEREKTGSKGRELMNHGSE
jgi:hypothetical protein